MREHVYDEINGWFDYHDLYKLMVEKAENNAHFVEVGSFVGKSLSYLIIENINSGKNIKIDSVDCFGWNVSIDFPWHGSRNVYECFVNNIKKFDLMGHMESIISDSVEASKLYNDETLDFVFINAGHDYYSVCNDIDAWLPKIKKGGYLAGHDYQLNKHDGVVLAVNEKLGKENITLHGHDGRDLHSWLYNKK